MALMLLLSEEDRDFAIYTRGFEIEAFTDRGQKCIENKIIKYLRDEDYYGAFNKFIELTDDFIRQAKTGKPYDTGNMPKKRSLPLTVLLISFTMANVRKASLKSVKFNKNADDYIVNKSIILSNSVDKFLYRNVSRTVRPKQTNSRNTGSTIQTGESGNRYNGRNGKY